MGNWKIVGGKECTVFLPPLFLVSLQTVDLTPLDVMDIHGYAWISMHIHAYPCISKGSDPQMLRIQPIFCEDRLIIPRRQYSEQQSWNVPRTTAAGVQTNFRLARSLTALFWKNSVFTPQAAIKTIGQNVWNTVKSMPSKSLCAAIRLWLPLLFAVAWRISIRKSMRPPISHPL